MEQISYSSDSDGFNAVGPTEASTLAGDTTDDDGTYIDRLTTPNPDPLSSPADMRSLLDAVGIDTLGPLGSGIDPDDTHASDSKPCTRWIPFRIAYATTDPVQVLPADPNRKALVIAPDADCRVASDRGYVYATTMYPIWPAGLGAVLDGHTGAVWFSAVSVDTTKYFNGWAITY